MNKITIASIEPRYGNVLAPCNELILKFVAKMHAWKGVQAVDVRPLTGGLSGATVAVVFPAQSTRAAPAPVVVKIDLIARVMDECRRYWARRAASHSDIATLLWPDKTSGNFIRLPGFDQQEYSILAYTYAGSGDRNRIETFDSALRSLVQQPSWQKTGVGLLESLKEILQHGFYGTVDSRTVKRRPFDLPRIPWNEFIPLAHILDCGAVDWNRLVSDLPKMWRDALKGQDANITYRPCLVHGDLRCANILLRNEGLPSQRPFLIDFGLSTLDHPLIDFARLEADILLRVVLPGDFHREILRSVALEPSLAPKHWTLPKASPTLQLLAELRRQALRVAGDCGLVEDQLESIYRLYLLGHSARFARLYDPAMRDSPRRRDYVWFVLALANHLLRPDDGPPPLPLASETVRDMQQAGIDDIYWGPDRRNVAKRRLLTQDRGPLRILAHTAQSFLDGTRRRDGTIAGVFFADLERALARGSPGPVVRVLLLNPYSAEGSKLGIAEARGNLKGPELDVEFHEKHTELFLRFDAALETLKRWCRERPGKIQARISHYAIDAAILLSEKAVFVEPYLVGRLSLRLWNPKRMNVPELHAPAGSELYRVADEQFEFLWRRAIELDEFVSRREEFRADFMRFERLRRNLVSLHESWFAVDPIVGCPNHCAYCFLRPFGINGTKPYLFCSAADSYQRLGESVWFNRQLYLTSTILQDDPRLPLPVAVGNYTEMTDDKEKYALDLPGGQGGMPTNNLELLLKLLDEHCALAAKLREQHQRVPPLCLITKRPLPDPLLKKIEEVMRRELTLRIAVFVSLSFLPASIEPESDEEGLLENFRKLRDLDQKLRLGSAGERRLAGIHFWRPLLRAIHCEPGVLDIQIHRVKQAGAVSSVAVGLKVSRKLAQQITNAAGKLCAETAPNGVDVDLGSIPEHSNELFPEDLRTAAIKAGENYHHPVFLHTSCAVAHALGRPDYNATYDGNLRRNMAHAAGVFASCGLTSDDYLVKENEPLGRTWILLRKEIDQEVQTFIRQMLGIEVKAATRATHEWTGSAACLHHGEVCRRSYCPEAQRSICGHYYNYT